MLSLSKHLACSTNSIVRTKRARCFDKLSMTFFFILKDYKETPRFHGIKSVWPCLTALTSKPLATWIT